MTTKCIPLPRLKHSRIRLNPTVSITETKHSPCNYELHSHGVRFRCPHCDALIHPTDSAGFKRVTVGIYTISAIFTACPDCKKPLFRVSEFDVMKYWER